MGDPVTADFTYIRWLGDCKRIEEITTVWNKLVIDRTAEMEEWLPSIEKLLKRPLTIYCLFNNHYGGSANQSARLFSEMLERTAGKGNAEIAHPAHGSAQQMNLL